MNHYSIDTNCVQGTYRPKNGEPRVLPICQSTTYKYTSAEELGDLFDLKVDGHMYTRISNPTVDAVEKKINLLEGGVGAMCTSSGQAATLLAVLNIASVGDNIVSLSAIYGGTLNLFTVRLKQFGIEVRFANPAETDAQLDALFDERTRLVFGETIANPALDVLDIERFARIAHAHGVPLIVDNTFATPILCRPFTFGADIVTHSTTKYMDGHATVVGGVIVDSGHFDWKAAGKYPELSKPDESYHGVVYTDAFKEAAYITKARVQLMRDLGSTPQPLTAFLLNLGLETLALRMERHCSNALTIAGRLAQNPNVEWVNYPGLADSPFYALSKKYLPQGQSGVISVGVKGGRNAAVKFLNSLELVSIVVHVADARSCALHPASTTHRQLTDEQLLAAGIGPELVRISVGIENVEDIWADIQQALEKAGR
ncbi:MAG: O-acetylhomoserine aminocarboxypropyltransferase/cysteine synthase [Clostridia bacterium]|nr:O-acetylhomoserine aminocarboxypropyltransferase/cysteine synthase [Clostridia bacterium]